MAEIQYGLVPLTYRRAPDDNPQAGMPVSVQIDLRQRGAILGARVFGNFLENLGYSIEGGVWAQALANPAFERAHNLKDKDIQALLQAGETLSALYLSGGDPAAIPRNWTPGIGATGFGVAILDDETARGVPLPWAALGRRGLVNASVGRIGGAVRIHGEHWDASEARAGAPDSGPGGVRQGVFLPIARQRGYHGFVWARIASENPAGGTVEVGLRRRLARPGKPAGEMLARQGIDLQGGEWSKLAFALLLPEGAAETGEPLDFTIRWNPAAGEPQDLLIDRAELYPDDAVDGLDPEIIRLAREWGVPLLRFPGGNYVSTFHWRDAVGDPDRRLTRANPAWGGLDTNAFGTDEFIRFCRAVGCEPHITVNTGTGTPEEAAAWVQYCNGSLDSPMGRLRALHGSPQPYNVRLWEVGNEIYGHWQGGYHGAEENARRYSEFAAAMRAEDPTIDLIATGNPFDFARPGRGYDHTAADRRWHSELLKQAGADLQYISLHALPANDIFLAHLSHDDAYYSLMGQVAAWEREFIPALLQMADEARGDAARALTAMESAATHSERVPPADDVERQEPVRLAITEWGVLGPRGDERPVVENYGEVIYAGLFLNMMVRNAARVPVANATALLHGGCIRKAGGSYYTDPQYPALQQFTRMTGGYPLAIRLETPGFDVTTACDLGAPLRDVPFVDVSAVLLLPPGRPPSLRVALTNCHLERPAVVRLVVSGGAPAGAARLAFMAGGDYTLRATPADPQPVQVVERDLDASDGGFDLTLPPLSVSWLTVPIELDHS